MYIIFNLAIRSDCGVCIILFFEIIATSHDILQNKLRTAGSSMMLSHAITNGTRQIVIAPIYLSLLTTKKPLLNRSHGSKMYLKNTWY